MAARERLEDKGEGEGIGSDARAAHCGEKLEARAGQGGGCEAAHKGVVEKGEVGSGGGDERKMKGEERGGVAEVTSRGDRSEAEELGKHRDGIGRREDVAATDEGGVEEPEVALRGAPAGADKQIRRRDRWHHGSWLPGGRSAAEIEEGVALPRRTPPAGKWVARAAAAIAWSRDGIMQICNEPNIIHHSGCV